MCAARRQGARSRAGGARTRSGRTFYDWTVEHPASAARSGGSGCRATWACSTPRPRRSAAAGGRADPRRPVRRRGRAARPAARPGRRATSPPTSRRRCSTAPWTRPASAASTTRWSRGSPTSATCRSRTASFDLVVSFTGLHCFPDPARAVVEMVRVLRPGGVITGSALLNDTGIRHEPIRRVGPAGRAARPGLHRRRGRCSWLGRAGRHRCRRWSAAARSATSAGSSAEPTRLPTVDGSPVAQRPASTSPVSDRVAASVVGCP